jgi:hypothetical protein
VAKDLARSIPTEFPSATPAKQPGWEDAAAYDPQVLSAAYGRGVTSALEGTKQLAGTARDYLTGLMQSVRERSPAQLQGTAPAQSRETFDAVNRALAEAGNNPLQAAKNLASGFVDVGREAVKSPASMTEFIAGNITPGRGTKTTTNVVKEKGGEFLQKGPGSSEDAAEALRRFALSSEQREMNKWAQNKLLRYIRNEMATPEDPIRKLAEEGILHVSPESLGFDLTRYGKMAFGDKPYEGQKFMASSDLAKLWEGATDETLRPVKAGAYVALAQKGVGPAKETIRLNPWIEDVAKRDQNKQIFSVLGDRLQTNLGFNHLRDELLNSINPGTDLPQPLRLTTDQLGRMSVPDAVRHVSKINKWREKKKAEANFALANNAATVPFKDYPDQKYGWFQLKADTPEGKKALSEALRYEGDMMGHCVGGYCDDVFSGATQIYSLRNKRTGEPHVTIEVEPNAIPFAQFKARIDEMFSALDENERTKILFETGYLDEQGNPVAFPSRILQIKGKANQVPKKEYLPFVQDFVKSGKWETVRDFQNTGLFDLMDPYPAGRQVMSWLESKNARDAAQTALNNLQAAGQRYVSEQELNDAYMQIIKQRNAERRAARPGTPEERRAARREARQNRRNQEN